MVAGPILVPVPVNLPSTAPLSTVKTRNIVPENISTSVPANHSTPNYSTPVDPAPVTTTTTTSVSPAIIPTITTVPINSLTIFSHAPDPKITTNVPSNPPTPVVPEPDTTTTTCVYSNHHTQNSPAPDPTQTPTPVSTIYYTPSPNTSTPTVVADCHGVKWYDYEDVKYLDELPSLQWIFTNKFGDTVYPISGVWVSIFDA